MKTAIEKTVAYFYNEKHDNYFGVESYKLKADGSFDCGTPSGIYCEKKMKAANIPYVGIKKDKTN